MAYQGIGSERHGDEVMVLQENLIVFKGFLRSQGEFYSLEENEFRHDCFCFLYYFRIIYI